ncbi:hypothetical protein CC80DRAFT_589067 [Byssothecium circinans]|uniref:Uncharacterized protein n=1 Tax=Byssothecium circinans TaxID=147558 RepID=A0A6A5UFN4_9PLEO|nr:hypothetical protein CC80DRAFT_589067 [Byssothecium circinans]
MDYDYAKATTTGNDNTNITGSQGDTIRSNNRIKTSFQTKPIRTTIIVILLFLVVTGVFLALYFTIIRTQLSKSTQSGQSLTGDLTSMTALSPPHSDTYTSLPAPNAATSSSSRTPSLIRSPSNPASSRMPSPAPTSSSSPAPTPAAVRSAGQACSNDSQCKSPNVCYTDNSKLTAFCCGTEIPGCPGSPCSANNCKDPYGCGEDAHVCCGYPPFTNYLC